MSTAVVTEPFTALPEGGVTTVRSGKYGPYQQVKREAETRWVLNPAQEGVPQVVVDLTTHHDPDGKYFRTSVTWATVESSDGYSTWCWGSDHAMVQVARTPVARYSVKALEAEHQMALSTVALRFEHFARVFNEAAERNGLTTPEEN